MMPALNARLPTHLDYGRATVAEILGEAAGRAARVEATELASMVFYNRGDQFEAKALPFEAQLAPAFGVAVDDCDGDGLDDVFLAQNFFAMQSKTSRADAGCGLWLRGDAQAGLVAVPGQESGIKVYGEQRGCALTDCDADGRVDLVVAQNAGETKLYRNVRARPGLRVRLDGPLGGRPTGNGRSLGAGAGDACRVGLLVAGRCGAGDGFTSNVRDHAGPDQGAVAGRARDGVHHSPRCAAHRGWTGWPSPSAGCWTLKSGRKAKLRRWRSARHQYHVCGDVEAGNPAANLRVPSGIGLGAAIGLLAASTVLPRDHGAARVRLCHSCDSWFSFPPRNWTTNDTNDTNPKQPANGLWPSARRSGARGF